MHHNDQPQSATSNRSRETSSASALWTPKRTRRRCSAVSAASAARTFSRTRVEGIDGGAARRRERRQSTFAAADVNDAFAPEGDEGTDSGRFDSSLVTAMHV
jgi:hypothetical protein